jgi:hypothetical protein
MLYTQWIQTVLKAFEGSENQRTRLVGLAIPALREPLGIALEDDDAIEDAVYDLEVLGLAHRRPNSFVSLTPAGREAAAQSIDAVCGDALRETCKTLTDDQRRFVVALVGLAKSEDDHLARLQYVDVAQVFEQIGLELPREQEESFLVPLVEKKCIDYREFEAGRDVSPLFSGIACAFAGSV